LFGDEIGGRWTAFFPSFEKDSEDDQEGSGGVGEGMTDGAWRKMP